MSTRETDRHIEDMKLRVADSAEKFAGTEDSIADTLEAAAAVGVPEYRGRRLAAAGRARAEAEKERIEAEKWRTIYAQEQRQRGNGGGD